MSIFNFGKQEVWTWDEAEKRFVCIDGRRYRSFEDMKRTDLHFLEAAA